MNSKFEFVPTLKIHFVSANVCFSYPQILRFSLNFSENLRRASVRWNLLLDVMFVLSICFGVAKKLSEFPDTLVFESCTSLSSYFAGVW